MASFAQARSENQESGWAQALQVIRQSKWIAWAITALIVIGPAWWLVRILLGQSSPDAPETIVEIFTAELIAVVVVLLVIEAGLRAQALEHRRDGARAALTAFNETLDEATRTFRLMHQLVQDPETKDHSINALASLDWQTKPIEEHAASQFQTLPPDSEWTPLAYQRPYHALRNTCSTLYAAARSVASLDPELIDDPETKHHVQLLLENPGIRCFARPTGHHNATSVVANLPSLGPVFKALATPERMALVALDAPTEEVFARVWQPPIPSHRTHIQQGVAVRISMRHLVPHDQIELWLDALEQQIHCDMRIDLRAQIDDKRNELEDLLRTRSDLDDQEPQGNYFGGYETDDFEMTLGYDQDREDLDNEINTLEEEVEELEDRLESLDQDDAWESLHLAPNVEHVLGLGKAEAMELLELAPPTMPRDDQPMPPMETPPVDLLPRTPPRWEPMLQTFLEWVEYMGEATWDDALTTFNTMSQEDFEDMANTALERELLYEPRLGILVRPPAPAERRRDA